MQIRIKIFDYNYTVNVAEDLTEHEQVDWFEKLNNAGSRISQVQMKFAKLLVQGVDIYVDYTNVFKAKLEDCRWGNLFIQKDTEVSIPIAALNPAYEVVTDRNQHILNFSPMPSDTKENHICSLEATQLKKCIELTLDALDLVIKFIKENGLKQPKRIDYLTYMVGLFVFNRNKDLTEDQKDALITWYQTAEFRNKSNDARRQMFNDLIKVSSAS